MFGGGYADTIWRQLGDTWVWRDGTWTQKLPTASPSPRRSHVMAYDTIRQKVVLYGGQQSSYGSWPSYETWEWDGTSWSLRTPSMTPPTAEDASMVFDEARQECLFFGGIIEPDDVPQAETWTWNGTDWTRKMPANSPQPLMHHAMAYDRARQRVVLFGGTTVGYGAVDETWEWDGTNWERKNPTAFPASRENHSMAYFEALGGVVMFGGHDSLWGTHYFGDTWLWNGVNWVQFTTGSMPTPRHAHMMVEEESRGDLVLFGGSDSTGAGSLNDTWLGTTEGIPLPVITAQPQSQTVILGSTVTFSVAATGTAPLSYQWRKDGTDISGATDVTLTLNNVQCSGGGHYSVVVGNGEGSVTSTEAMLSVQSLASPYREERRADMPVANAAMACSEVVNGKVYLFGGAPYGGDPLSDTIYVYDTVADSWRIAAGTMPYRYDASGDKNLTALWGGKIYISAGTGPTVNNGWGQHHQVIEFDPATETAVEKASFRAVVWCVSPVTIGDYIYWFGAAGPGQEHKIWRYDPAADVLVHVSNLAGGPRNTAAVRGADGRAYAYGGQYYGQQSAKIDIYDPVANSCVVSGASLPQPASGLHVWPGPGNLIYMNGPPYTSLWRYDAAADSITDLGLRYSFYTCAQMGHAYDPNTGRVYFFGGWEAGGPWANTLKGTYVLIPDCNGSPLNRPPVANAGPDQTVECQGGQTPVTLDGRGSSDPDGGLLGYEWREGTILLGTNVSLQVGLALGSHSIELKVTDPRGASSQDTVIVNVADTTPPTITCPANIVKTTDPGQCSAFVNYTVTATDNLPDVSVVCSPPSGSAFPVGSSTVTCTATDSSGNTADCAFSVNVAQPVSIASSFNGTAIKAGSTNAGNAIWFNSVLTPRGLSPTHPVTIRFFGQQITSANFSVNVADAVITFDPAATTATTSFTGGQWVTRVPASGLAGKTFLSGFGYPVLNDLPGGINPVIWSGTFVCDTPGVTLQWQWAAAVYAGFGADESALGVKPVDDNKASPYKNSDHAGTPENYKSSVIGGARGGGGSNYTGSYSGTGSVTPCAGH